MKESLRLFGPTWVSFTREITKTVKIGNLTVQKGTRVVILYQGYTQVIFCLPGQLISTLTGLRTKAMDRILCRFLQGRGTALVS